ncbi:unnamed protein product [Acanthoscelides obtectus]|uniref:Uncharacterized protein n=1 Tax=Acanthoscelides obtectus TaxID=200917 RepID=A0A9P0LIL6_ACAOB|nr:unnamed protein product [Acanthoscelides obtectus]CAK1658149.1 hypothetical protein AOBTE_LOCUS20728 [Acanthoscelides obtectus]
MLALVLLSSYFAVFTFAEDLATPGDQVKDGSSLSLSAYAYPKPLSYGIYGEDFDRPHSAARNAEYEVKSNYAAVAAQNAKTAKVALHSKLSIVSSLKHQLASAQHRLHGETDQYRQSEVAAKSAQHAAAKAHAQVHELTHALTVAHANAQKADLAAAEADKVAATQKDMVFHAKQIVANLVAQLKVALAHLLDTEASVKKAQAAAEESYANAKYVY